MRISGRHFDITPAQCRAARAVLSLTQPELGRLSNLSRDVIVRLERGAAGLHYTTPGLVESALASLGVTLLHDEIGSGLRIARTAPIDANIAATEIITPAQCRAARAMLDISVRQLANLVRLNKRFLHDLEGEQGQLDVAKLRHIRATLVVNGIIMKNEASFVAVQMTHWQAETTQG
jgi:DNA-binding transcriptional regulator YiaG